MPFELPIIILSGNFTSNFIILKIILMFQFDSVIELDVMKESVSTSSTVVVCHTSTA